MLLKIKEEVKKQLDTGFLEVSKYPQWVANIVLVSMYSFESGRYLRWMESPPIKQKLRRVKPKMLLKIKEGVKK